MILCYAICRTLNFNKIRNNRNEIINYVKLSNMMISMFFELICFIQDCLHFKKPTTNIKIILIFDKIYYSKYFHNFSISINIYLFKSTFLSIFLILCIIILED